MHFNQNRIIFIFNYTNIMFLSQYLDFQKRGSFEWILAGYTKPFLSMSPSSLLFEKGRPAEEIKD
jgi:hypothetical protein